PSASAGHARAAGHAGATGAARPVGSTATAPTAAGRPVLPAGASATLGARPGAALEHLAVDGNRFDGAVFGQRHRVADSIDGDLLPDRQLHRAALGAEVDEVAVVEDDAVHFAVAGVVQGLHGGFRVDEL